MYFLRSWSCKKQYLGSKIDVWILISRFHSRGRVSFQIWISCVDKRSKLGSTNIMSAKFVRVIRVIGTWFWRYRSTRIVAFLGTERIIGTDTTSWWIGTSLAAFSQDFLLWIEFFSFQFQLFHLCFAVLKLFLQLFQLSIIFSVDVSDLIQLLFNFFSSLFGCKFLFSCEKRAYLFVLMVKLLF